jgi:hypothetical protein
MAATETSGRRVRGWWQRQDVIATRYDKLAANHLAFVNPHQSEFG